MATTEEKSQQPTPSNPARPRGHSKPPATDNIKLGNVEVYPTHKFRDGGDTLIYIDPVSGPRTPLRLPSSTLLSSGSAVLQKFLSPTYQYRVLRRRKLLRDGLPMGVKFVIDLTPPVDGEEAVEVTEKLWCPDSVRRWKTSDLLLKIRYVEVDIGGDVPSQPTPSELEKFYNANWGNTKKSVSEEEEKEKAEEAAERILPVAYSNARHVAALDRLLGALMGEDPHIYSATMWYTFVRVAEMLELGPKVADYVVKWLYSGNHTFVEFFTPLCMEIADGIRAPLLFRECFAITVARQLAGSSDMYPVQDDPSSPYQANVNAACRVMEQRVKAKWEYILGMTWLDTKVPIMTLLSEWAQGEGKYNSDFSRAARLAYDMVRDIVAEKLLDVKKGNALCPVSPPHIDPDTWTERSLSFLGNPTEKDIFNRYRWMQLRSIDLSLLMNDHLMFDYVRRLAFHHIPAELIDGETLLWPKVAEATPSEQQAKQEGSSALQEALNTSTVNAAKPQVIYSREVFDCFGSIEDYFCGFGCVLRATATARGIFTTGSKDLALNSASPKGIKTITIRKAVNNPHPPAPLSPLIQRSKFDGIPFFTPGFPPTNATNICSATIPSWSEVSQNPTLTMVIERRLGIEARMARPGDPTRVHIEFLDPADTCRLSGYDLYVQIQNWIYNAANDFADANDTFLGEWLDFQHLQCLTDNEWRYMPAWAGGEDDGSGAIFSEKRSMVVVGSAGPPPPKRQSAEEEENDDDLYSVTGENGNPSTYTPSSASGVMIDDDDLRSETTELGVWSVDGSVSEVGDNAWERVGIDEDRMLERPDTPKVKDVVDDFEMIPIEDDGDGDESDEDDQENEEEEMGDDPAWAAEIDRNF